MCADDLAEDARPLHTHALHLVRVPLLRVFQIRCREPRCLREALKEVLLECRQEAKGGALLGTSRARENWGKMRGVVTNRAVTNREVTQRVVTTRVVTMRVVTKSVVTDRVVTNRVVTR